MSAFVVVTTVINNKNVISTKATAVLNRDFAANFEASDQSQHATKLADCSKMSLVDGCLKKTFNKQFILKSKIRKNAYVFSKMKSLTTF